MREIGSEFWGKSLPVYSKSSENEAYLLSGRTALSFIIGDACAYKKSITSILLLRINDFTLCTSRNRRCFL